MVSSPLHPVMFVAGDRKIDAAGGPRALLLATVVSCVSFLFFCRCTLSTPALQSPSTMPSLKPVKKKRKRQLSAMAAKAAKNAQAAEAAKVANKAKVAKAGSKKAKPTAKTKAPNAASGEGGKVISTKPTKNSAPPPKVPAKFPPRNPEQPHYREARNVVSATRQKTQCMLRGHGKGSPSEDDDLDDVAAVTSGASVVTSGSSDSNGSSSLDRKPPKKKGCGGDSNYFKEYMEERGFSHLDCRDRIALICKARMQPGEREKVCIILDINQIDYFQCKYCGIIRKPSVISKHKWKVCSCHPWYKRQERESVLVEKPVVENFPGFGEDEGDNSA